jgi:hypothetical protein
VKINVRTHLCAHDYECRHNTQEYDMYLVYQEMRNSGGTDDGYKPASSEFFRRLRVITSTSKNVRGVVKLRNRTWKYVVFVFRGTHCFSSQ